MQRTGSALSQTIAGAADAPSPLSSAQAASIQAGSIKGGPLPAAGTIVAILGAVSFGHLVNDLLQSLVPAVYPVLKSRFSLSFGQIGAITLVYQLTASILQPIVGHITDRRPMPFSLPAAMAFTLAGLLMLSAASSYPLLLASVALIGIGSSVFHPESSRVARLASGGRHGLAQSVFQVGGNTGASLGPLMAAFVVAPHMSRSGVEEGGQGSIAWFGLIALVGIAVLATVGVWYRSHARAKKIAVHAAGQALPKQRVVFAMGIILALMLSKFFYLASMGNYYTFYLMNRFHLPVQTAQLCLFLFLGSFAAGTLIGGPIGDRIGRRRIIWASIAGVLPFTLALPYLPLAGVVAMTIPIGLLLASAFPAMVVYAQELVPGRIGTVSGLVFGLAFGLGGLGAALLGLLADATSIGVVFQVCAFLPAIGLLAAFLPDPSSHDAPESA